MNVIETERLLLRRLVIEDAEFIFDLVNQPSFLHFIGDRGVRTIEDARDYILKGPMDSYERFGFGLYLTALKESRVPIGMCGLIKRESLKDVDIGFAFLPQFWRQGYAYESAAAVLEYGRNRLGLKRVVGIATQDNHGSIRVLEKIGLKFENMVKLPEDDVELKLFGLDV